MRAVGVEMVLVLAEHRQGMPFVVDQEPVGAFLADGAYEPFGEPKRRCPVAGSARRLRAACVVQAGRMHGDAEDVHGTGTHLSDEQDIQSAKADGVNMEEIDGQQPNA